MRKILFTGLCGALLVSCASQKSVMVEPAITEAKVLLALAKANGVEVSVSTNALISDAEKQNENRQTEEAFLRADEAILRLQMSLLEKENKSMADSLAKAAETLKINRSLLEERKGAHSK